MQTQTHLLNGADCLARREELELSRSELARLALVDEATVYRLETGARVSDLTRRRLAAAIEQIRRQGKQMVRTHGYQAAREAIVNGDFERLGRISPDERRAAVASAEELARSMPTSERAAEVAQRRLERMREIVAEAEIAA